MKSLVQRLNEALTIPEDVQNYLYAYTSMDSELYKQYSKYNTLTNKKKCIDWLTKQPKLNNVIVYRLINTTEKDWSKRFESGYVETGNIITDLGDDIKSFTTDLNRTATFVNGSEKILYKVKTTGKHFVDISKYSIYPEECEVLMLPNTHIEVLDWDYDRKVIIDSKEVK